MSMIAPRDMLPLPQSVEWFLVRDPLKSMPARNGREGYTLGEIRYGFFDSQRVCYTVEDFDYRLEEGNGKPLESSSAMPAGRYKLSIHQSPHHGHQCIRIHKVDGFCDLEINANGTAERLLGCVSVGTERMPDGVRNSKPALAVLVAELRKMNHREIGVYLNVVRAE
jgi:hypothetical protein